MDEKGKQCLIRKGISNRDRILADLKKQIDGFVADGGNVSYDRALEAIQSSVRFAAEIGSIADLESFRPAA